MRTKIYLAAVTLLLLITSCEAIDNLLTFTIDNQTTFKIASGFPSGTRVSWNVWSNYTKCSPNWKSARNFKSCLIVYCKSQ